MSRDGFLSRWSRRKAEARQAERESDQASPLPEEAPVDSLPTPADDVAQPETAPEDDEPLDLPDIDSLTKDSDYTVFLKDKVPAALRKQALRKLWRSDPVLANLDGLNDYDDDFTTPAVSGAAVRTAYNALRGYAKAEGEQETLQEVEESVDMSEQDAAVATSQSKAYAAMQQEEGPPPSGGESCSDTDHEKRDRKERDSAGPNADATGRGPARTL